MRYHLFLNSFRKMFKIAKVFSRKLAVPRYMSTSVLIHITTLKDFVKKNRIVASKVFFTHQRKI